MKQLFETAELEAEIFRESESLEEHVHEFEYGLEEILTNDIEALEHLSEDGTDDFPALELTLELSDGRVLEYEVVTVFIHGDKEYIGLHPKSDTEGLIHIMQLLQGEDDSIELLPIKEEEELIAVYDKFFQMYADDFETEDASENQTDGNQAGESKKTRRFRVR